MPSCACSRAGGAQHARKASNSPCNELIGASGEGALARTGRPAVDRQRERLRQARAAAAAWRIAFHDRVFFPGARLRHDQHRDAARRVSVHRNVARGLAGRKRRAAEANPAGDITIYRRPRRNRAAARPRRDRQLRKNERVKADGDRRQETEHLSAPPREHCPATAGTESPWRRRLEGDMGAFRVPPEPNAFSLVLKASAAARIRGRCRGGEVKMQRGRGRLSANAHAV